MKARIREVNIFSMSLLDILCGALGAFCFLMLSLFPDHLRVKELEARLAEMEDAKAKLERAEADRDRARAEQSLVYFKVWWGANVDVDMWVQLPDGRYFAAKPVGLADREITGKVGDVTRGPGNESVWFADVARPGQRYRLLARLQSAAAGAGAVKVNGYITARVPRGERSAMGLYDLGLVELTRAGEVRELGSIRFEKEDFNVTAGPGR